MTEIEKLLKEYEVKNIMDYNCPIVYEDKEFTNQIRKHYQIFLNKNMKSFIGYALGQTKKFGIKGVRYDELDSFVKSYLGRFTMNGKLIDRYKDTKLSDKYQDMKEFFTEKDYKYMKFVMANSNRDSNEKQEYISILGKLFLGTVTFEYFYDRVIELYDQFGNRTKSQKNANEALMEELSELKRLL